MTLPTGVTLQQIDGGSTYYASNGFTYAANAGWDDPNFYPIGPWLAPMHTQADANRWIDLGWNTAFALTGNSSLSLLRANGIDAILQQNELNQFGPLGIETVGLLAVDEPTSYSQVTGPISSTPNSVQDGRFWWLNNTHNFLEFGDLGGVPSSQVLSNLITTPNGTQRHIDTHSTDLYWFAGAEAPFWRSVGGGIFGLGRSATSDEMSRGSHFGMMVDWAREYQTAFSIPIFQFVETGGPYTENTSASNYITPPELNWAVWSSIIQGARGIVYFNHTFAGPGDSFDNLADTYYRTVQPGQTTSIYDQVNATDALVEQMAPVINSPTALNYVTAGALTDFSGIETMAKYYQGEFYIFADTRYSESMMNISATFTINDPTATSVTVVNEGRTIPIVDGVFTDMFARAWTVHIYDVNYDGEPPPPDTTPPNAPVIVSFSTDTGTLGDGRTTDTTLVLTGTAEASSTVTVSDGTSLLGQAAASGSGAWTFSTAALSLATHTFTATAADAAGNVSVASAPLAVTVEAPPPVGVTINGTSSHDTLPGTAGNDTINGLNGQDLIDGAAGNDLINAGGGRDWVDGGLGTDTLWGNGGADEFVFKAGEAGGDTVADFSGNGSRTGDILMFLGFGDKQDGATFTRIDTTHWQIHSALDGHNEIITLSNSATVHPNDFLFI